MSFIPSTCATETISAVPQDPSGFSDHIQTSSLHGAVDEMKTADYVPSDNYTEMHSTDWRQNEQEPLAFAPLDMDITTAYSDETVAAPCLLNHPYIRWASPYVDPISQDASPYHERRDSCAESASLDPKYTLLPGAYWDPLLAYATSPSQSGCSTSTLRSAISSPFGPSDCSASTASSRKIKVEDPQSYDLTELHYVPELTPLEFSHLVNPDAFITHSDTPPPKQEDVEIAVLLDPVDVAYETASSHGRDRLTRRQSIDDKTHIGMAKHKREYTRPENASCSCKQCGKLFQRSYNLRAHMQTHDPHRNQPHTCKYCARRFSRRADLARHESSVHVKSRDFKCCRCESSFSRKDTLRRHEEDGCPKRVEVRKRISDGRHVSVNSTKARRVTRRAHKPLTTAWPLLMPTRRR